jgi:parallel beta-helix repeat protein
MFKNIKRKNVFRFITFLAIAIISLSNTAFVSLKSTQVSLPVVILTGPSGVISTNQPSFSWKIQNNFWSAKYEIRIFLPGGALWSDIYSIKKLDRDGMLLTAHPGLVLPAGTYDWSVRYRVRRNEFSEWSISDSFTILNSDQLQEVPATPTPLPTAAFTDEPIERGTTKPSQPVPSETINPPTQTTNPPTPFPTATEEPAVPPTQTAIPEISSPSQTPLSATATSIPAQPGIFTVSQMIEAEDGVISAPFQIADGSLYQLTTTNPELGGKAEYSIQIPVDGSYIIKGLVNAAGDPNNSFYLSFDSEPTDPMMIWDIVTYTNGYEERMANWRGNGTWADQEFDPKVFELSAGIHKLIIRGREANTFLDRFIVEKYVTEPAPIETTIIPTEVLAETTTPVPPTATAVAPTATPIPPTPQVTTPITGAYYVATNGSDSNPGTLEKPWRTIQYGVNQISAGETLYVRGGEYQEYVTVSRSGTSGNPIEVRAYPGETPVIDGNSYQLPNTWGAMLKLSGSYIEVTGFEVRNSDYIGVLLAGAHNRVSEMNVHHGKENGILITGDYGIVENSEVWLNCLSNRNGVATRSGWASGLSAARHPNNAVIRNNKVHDNWGEGLSTYEANGTLIEGNEVYDNYTGNIYISDVTNVVVQRNLVYTTGDTEVNQGPRVGIMVGDELYNPASSDITIINNIVYGAYRNFYWWQGVKGGGMKNIEVVNNTFVNSRGSENIRINCGEHSNTMIANNLVVQEDGTAIALVCGGGLTIENNLWSKRPPTSARGNGDVVGDPELMLPVGGGFVQPDLNFFKFSNTSPAIDHGKVIASVQEDFFQQQRDNMPDIGAYEVQVR